MAPTAVDRDRKLRWPHVPARHPEQGAGAQPGAALTNGKGTCQVSAAFGKETGCWMSGDVFSGCREEVARYLSTRDERINWVT